MSETIDTDECAALLKCSPAQVEELARSGEIPGLKLGKGWLFIRSDLLSYLGEKARQEAQARRSSRQPGAVVRTIKPSRRMPPALPQPARM